MPRAMRSNLAQKLAAVALGAATLAITAGQLPALAAYGPPPPPPPAPGGYSAVVTSTDDRAGRRSVGPVRSRRVSVALTVPPERSDPGPDHAHAPPTVRGSVTAGQPGYRAICGVGVLIQVNGKAYTGNFGHPLTLDISGFQIRPGDRVVVVERQELRTFVPATDGRSHGAVQPPGSGRTSRCCAAGRVAGRTGSSGRRRVPPASATAPVGARGSHQPVPRSRRPFPGRGRGAGSGMADRDQPLNQRRGAGSSPVPRRVSPALPLGKPPTATPHVA